MPKVKKSNKPVHPLSRKALQLSRKEHHKDKRGKRKDELNIKQQVKLKKLLWFKDNIDREKTTICSAEEMLDLIDRYFHRFDEEIDKANEASNIKGRKVTGHLKQDYSLNFVPEKEAQDFDTCGLEVPDLMNKNSFEAFLAWNGEQRFLTSIKMSTVTQASLNAQISKQKARNEESVCEEGT